MIKIGFYNQALKTGHQFRGIGNYAKNLLEYLKKTPGTEVEEFSDLKKIKNVDLVHFPSFDLFHLGLPLKKRFPMVLTIHDVTPLLFPQFYPPGIKGKAKFYLQKLLVKRADAIITDSENSKRDIVKYLKVDDRRISSIYLAQDKKFQVVKDVNLLKKISEKYNLPKVFAIFIGSVNWNKNLLNTAEACLRCGIDLVLVGKDFQNRENLDHPELESFKEFLEKYEKDPQIHILGFIETDHLVLILNQAKVLLLPSFYEGFGLPILEAQACGVPVITSNISSMPEVAGDGALLVNPNNLQELSDGIMKILSDQNYKKLLVNRGLKNIKRFSWKETTKETINVYESVIKKH